MGDHALDVADLEEISESFVCCVCQDLLYKPIVLSCGHISCFWCVHISMDGLRESHCPICRNPYNYFPNICQMLHFLLQKMYPLTYKKRELQILEEEKHRGFFSPQFDDDGNGSLAKQELHCVSNPACEASPENPEQCGTVVDNKKDSPQNHESGNYKLVTLADVLCVECRQLLFRPVALNCGHVYCESCLIHLCDEIISCRICQSLHPKGFPKVCLELCQFLEQCFPKEYALRGAAVQRKQVDSKHESLITCSTGADEQGHKAQWWSDPGSNVHFAVGCDSCGMYPIIGERYKCKDCVEISGFDLCGNCYNTSSKLPGRFNQQHTPEHKFERVQSNTSRNIMLRLVTGRFEDASFALGFGNYSSENSDNGSTALVIGNHSSENSEDRSSPLSPSGSASENVDNGSTTALASSPGDGQDQDDAQTPT